MSETPLKILAIGSPLSALSTLSNKISAINSKHGPFDACVIAGDVFKPDSDGSELEGVSMPIPTYFTLGTNPLPEVAQASLAAGPEVAPNLVFLGRGAVFTTAQGLRIGCVGGAYDPARYDTATNPLEPVLSKSSVTTLTSHPSLDPSSPSSPQPASLRGLDILLLSHPPPGLSLLSPSFSGTGLTLAPPAPPLKDAVDAARPRYLFWAEGEGFWEREPWVWEKIGKDGDRTTRAIKLGALGDGKKARWHYAFTLPPNSTTSTAVKPTNATPNPLSLTSNTVVPVPSHSAAGGDAYGRKRSAAGGNMDEEYAGGAGGVGGYGGDAKRVKGEEKGEVPEGYVCKICQTPGHWIQDCPQKQQPTDHSKPRDGYVCNICQSPDHFIRDCPNKEDRPPRTRGPPPGYVCKACGQADAHYIRECPMVKERDEERAKKRDLGPAECWFCLSNPKVTKHLIVAIGSETYVTLPKGQVTPTRGVKPLVPGGGHVLIIPIAHHPTLLSIPAADAISIIAELESYKSSLRQCYASYSAVPVTFEVGRLSGRGGHAHVQIVPVPQELGPKVADAFRAAGAHAGLDWEEEPERALARVGSTGNYFKVECPDGRKLVHLLKGHFDLQFGRTVIAGLLGVHDRADWKACVQSDAEDKEDAKEFKKALAPFLPS